MDLPVGGVVRVGVGHREVGELREGLGRDEVGRLVDAGVLGVEVPVAAQVGVALEAVGGNPELEKVLQGRQAVGAGPHDSPGVAAIDHAHGPSILGARRPRKRGRRPPVSGQIGRPGVASGPTGLSIGGSRDCSEGIRPAAHSSRGRAFVPCPSQDRFALGVQRQALRGPHTRRPPALSGVGGLCAPRRVGHRRARRHDRALRGQRRTEVARERRLVGLAQFGEREYDVTRLQDLLTGMPGIRTQA